MSTVYTTLSALGTAHYFFIVLKRYLAPDDPTYELWSQGIGPILSLGFCLSIFVKPRRTDKTYLALLHVQFCFHIIAPEIFLILAAYGLKNPMYWIGVVFRAPFLVFAYLLSLSLRKRLAQKSDKDLSEVLTWICTRGIAGVPLLLYLNFQGIRCFIENSDKVDLCRNPSTCVSAISFYIVVYSLIRLVVKISPNDGRKHKLENLATMNISWMRKTELLFTTLSVGCGLFLFANLKVESR